MGDNRESAGQSKSRISDKLLQEQMDFWKEKSGDAYRHLMDSKGSAIALMQHVNADVRITAISVCYSYWKCSVEEDFRTALKELVSHDPVVWVQKTAADFLGGAYCDTQDNEVSHLLAVLAAQIDLPLELRQAAYWALREVQLGITALDLIKRRIREAKQLSRIQGKIEVPLATKNSLLRNGRIPESVWESAEEIDLEFIRRVLFSSR